MALRLVSVLRRMGKGWEMFETRKKLVLASGSPRRKRFLSELGLDFEVCPANVNEAGNGDEKPGEYVARIAGEKALAISLEMVDAWVVAADTIVSIGADLLGKPESEKEAVTLLMQLSGKEHEVLTGYCICHKNSGFFVVKTEMTSVRFTRFKEDVARAYVKTGEPLDKAGAYGIQGKGGMLVDEINGSYSNVVGLPLSQVISLLLKKRVIAVRH